MVVWELTLATAYFLGLRRTYRLALKLQRRLVAANNPRIRAFLHGRTRAVFGVAVSVHKSIQQRDIEVGRNLGNWILRYLDRLKPSAQIRAPSGMLTTSKQMSPSHRPVPPPRPASNLIEQQEKNKGRLLFTRWSVRAQSFPPIVMMMKQIKPPGTNSQVRPITHHLIAPLMARNNGLQRFRGVLRDDIARFMLS